MICPHYFHLGSAIIKKATTFENVQNMSQHAYTEICSHFVNAKRSNIKHSTHHMIVNHYKEDYVQLVLIRTDVPLSSQYAPFMYKGVKCLPPQ